MVVWIGGGKGVFEIYYGWFLKDFGIFGCLVCMCWVDCSVIVVIEYDFCVVNFVIGWWVDFVIELEIEFEFVGYDEYGKVGWLFDGFVV